MLIMMHDFVLTVNGVSPSDRVSSRAALHDGAVVATMAKSSCQASEAIPELQSYSYMLRSVNGFKTRKGLVNG